MDRSDLYFNGALGLYMVCQWGKVRCYLLSCHAFDEDILNYVDSVGALLVTSFHCPWIYEHQYIICIMILFVTADPNFIPPGFPGGPVADQEQDKGRGRGMPANQGPWRGRGLRGRGIPPGFHRNYTEDDKGEALYFESDSSGSSSSGKRKKKKRHRRRSYSSS